VTRGLRLPALLVSAVAAAALAACGSTAAPAPPPPSGSTSAALSGTVTVFAAASLQETFTTLAKQVAAAHPGLTVTPSFGASSALAQQIDQGAPADVFASASQTNMDQLVQAGAATSSTVFATNVMAVVVPPANPAAVTSVADLARPDVKVALCHAQVPCGSVAAKVFANAKVTVTPVTQEADVKAVLTKVRLGEVDAGVVYVTDVLAAGDEVTGVRIPDDLNASTSYPIATLTGSAAPATATVFVDYVLSPAGTDVLAAAGFRRP
jgi:molybdate transport system substrate-binding protein